MTGILCRNMARVYTLAEKQLFRIINFQSVRNLYSEEHLGLPSFRRQRVAASEKFGSNLKEQYIERLIASIRKTPSDPVFSDDIKTVISLAETKDDVNLMVELLRRYLKQSNELVPDFRFGPLIMRVLMLTGQCDFAMSIYRDPELHALFQQFTSIWLFLDMLYEESRCLEALQVYDDFIKICKEKTIPAACTTLALASCYKMASEEAFERCLEILKNSQATGSTVGSRGVCFAAMLALKLHKPGVCLEILALRPRSLKPTPLNNLRAIALAELGRIEDAIQILRFVFHQEESSQKSMPSYSRKRPTIFPDTIDRINAAAFNSENKTVVQKMRNIENSLRDEGHVISGQRFDDFLGMPIRLPKKTSSRFSGYSQPFAPSFHNAPRRRSRRDEAEDFDDGDVELSNERLSDGEVKQ